MIRICEKCGKNFDSSNYQSSFCATCSMALDVDADQELINDLNLLADYESDYDNTELPDEMFVDESEEELFFTVEDRTILDDDMIIDFDN